MTSPNFIGLFKISTADSAQPRNHSIVTRCNRVGSGHKTTRNSAIFRSYGVEKPIIPNEARFLIEECYLKLIVPHCNRHIFPSCRNIHAHTHIRTHLKEAASVYPSCRHTAFAWPHPNPVQHSGSHWRWVYSSTIPTEGVFPPMRRTSPE